MHAAKVKNILSMDGQSRYNYFVEKVADFKVVWSLKSTGWVLVADAEGRIAAPFWPESEFAQLCAKGEFADAKADSVDLEAFVDRWLTGLEKDQRLVAVFPTPNDRGVVVAPNQLLVDLRNAMAQYE